MEKTRVVNLNHEDYDVFIGRPSLWGNPFRIGRDGDRTEVLRKFEYWIRNEVPHLIDMACEVLKGQTLGCYCKPLACHGDIWVKLINEREKRRG